MNAHEPAESWVWLARILRPQGRKGEVFAEVLTDFPEKFAQRRRLWLLSAGLPAQAGRLAPAGTAPDEALSRAPREVGLAAHWPHKGGIVLHFEGIDSITAAEALKGLIVAIPRAERAALARDETYIGDLIGCALIDVAPRDKSGAEPVTVGEIEEVDRTAGETALLVVRGAAGEVLIPFAKSYLRGIDIENRRVEMALPEGLADLNGPEKS